MSSLILPKKFQHIHRVMNTNVDGNRMIPIAIKISSTSLHTPLLRQKRCCSSNTPQDDITVRYSLKELIKSVHDSQKELLKQVDESIKQSHDSQKELFKQVDESIKQSHDSQKELFKQVDESIKQSHKHTEESIKLSISSLRAELQPEFRALTLHMRIMIGLLLLTIGILAREWIASVSVKPKSDGPNIK